MTTIFNLSFSSLIILTVIFNHFFHPNSLKQPQGAGIGGVLNDKARYFGQNTNVFTKG